MSESPIAKRLSEASVVMEGTPHPELVSMLKIGAEEIQRLWELAEKRYNSIQVLKGKIATIQKNCEHDWAETLHGPNKVGEHCLICDVDRDYDQGEP